MHFTFLKSSGGAATLPVAIRYSSQVKLSTSSSECHVSSNINKQTNKQINNRKNKLTKLNMNMERKKPKCNEDNETKPKGYIQR